MIRIARFGIAPIFSEVKYVQLSARGIYVPFLGGFKLRSKLLAFLSMSLTNLNSPIPENHVLVELTS